MGQSKVSQDPIGFNGRDENLYGYVGNSPTNATDPSGLIDLENHGSTEYPEVYHPKTVMLPPWWAHECCQCDDNLPASQGQQRLSIGALDTPPMTAERSKQYAIAEMEYQIRQAQQYGRSTALLQADLMKMQIRPAAPAPLLVTLGPQDAGYGLYWDVLAIAGAVAKGPNPIKTAAGAHYPYRVGAPSNNPVATAPLNPGAPSNLAPGLRTWQEARISPNHARRIQNAVNKTNQQIAVVGSRAKGTADPASDWDFIFSGKSRQRGKAKASIPRGAYGGENNSGIDCWQDFNPLAPNYNPIDPNRPHVIFKPNGGF